MSTSENSAKATQDLQLRTKLFAVRVIKLCRVLGRTPGEGWVMRDQLLRCGTAVAANYRAACRARSKAEFAAKLGIVVEEANETIFWFELLTAAGTLSEGQLKSLSDEAHELLRIFSSARHTTLSQIKNQQSTIKNCPPLSPRIINAL